MNNDKEKLIKELYNSFTNDEFPDIKADNNSRFDESTGTLYSNVQDASEIKKARIYFESVYQKLAGGTTIGEKQKAMLYYIAIEALKDLENKRRI